MTDNVEVEPGLFPDLGTIRLTVSGKTVHSALKALLTRHLGLTREEVIATLIKKANLETAVRDWLNGAHMREFVGRIAREIVRGMADEILREEVKRAVSGKFRIVLSDQ
jgi:hypothetical protein